MPPRSSVPKPATGEFPLEPLSAAIQELAQNVRVLTDLVQEARSDLQWISQNGIPHQEVTVRIVPSTGANSPALAAEVVSVRDPPASAPDLQESCEWLAEHLTGICQEQLNLIIGAQEQHTKHILRIIKGDGPPGRNTGRDNTPSESAVLQSTESAARTPLVDTEPETSAAPASGESVIPTCSAAPPMVDRSAPPPRLAQRKSARAKQQSSIFSVDDPPPVDTDVAMPPADVHGADKAVLTAAPALPEIALHELGEAVSFMLDGRELWGEIVFLDDAHNTATVLVIPSEEEVTVSQDRLCPETHARNCTCVDPLAALPDQSKHPQRA